MTPTKGSIQVKFLQDAINAGSKITKANFVIDQRLTSTTATVLLTLQQREQKTLQEFLWTPELEEFLLIKSPIRMETQDEEIARFSNILGNNLKNAEKIYGEEFAQSVFVLLLKQKPQYSLDDLLEKIPTGAPYVNTQFYPMCFEYLQTCVQGLSNTLVWCLNYPNDQSTANLIGNALRIVLDVKFHLSLKEKLFPKITKLLK